MKKIVSTMAVAAALFAGYSAYSGQNSNELSDVALANVEAMSACEITRGDKIILRCDGEEGTCTAKYMGHVLTCTGKKVAI